MNTSTILTFKLHGLSLLKHPRKEFNMVLGKNTYVFEFDVDSFWHGKKMAAEFVSGAITLYSPIIDMKCEIPELILKQPDFYLTVIGETNDGTRLMIWVQKTILPNGVLSCSGTTCINPPPPHAQQIQVLCMTS